MEDQEILDKAINTAKKNGWKTNIITRNIGHEYQAIFSHGFAKAFWGDKDWPGVIRYYHSDKTTLDFKPLKSFMDNPDNFPTRWQGHLQNMVMCKNPIDYLRKFIEE